MENAASGMKERDQLLPECRKALQTKIEKDLLDDERVLAAFYGGSIGAEAEDRFSDIDLRIVVEEKDFAGFIAAKRSRAEQYGQVLYFEESNPASNHTVAHYADFIKVDSFYYQKSAMVPSVWLQQIKLIKDADALVRKIQAESRLLGYSPTPSEVENWRTKFLANLHETYRRAMRGEYYYALKSLDNLRLAMALAWYMEQGIQPNAYGDWAHYEGDRSRLRLDQQTLLSTWHCQRDGSEMIAVCRQIVPEFLKVNRSLCGKTGIEENQEKLLEMIRLVL